MISLRSEITKKLLNYLFLNPHESLYINELTRQLAVDKRNLVKKINELEEEGILQSQRRGNLKLYSLNLKYPLYNEYRKIILKTVGFEHNLKESLKRVKGIKEAFIYGSYARDKLDSHSDIDILVVGSHSIALLQKELNELAKQLNREINVVNMDEQEFNKKIKKDPFITGILKGKHIKITI